MACFGCVAVVAAKLCENNIDPCKAWDTACKKFSLSDSMQKKDCPKNTFLGLCSDGWIKNVPNGGYTKSVKNKSYGIAAVQWLIAHKDSPTSPAILWNAIGHPCKHNQQMNVVVALWENNFILNSGTDRKGDSQ